MKKEHYEYTQEEWLEKQRKERISEFAPLQIYHTQRKFTKDRSTNETITEPNEPGENQNSLFFTTRQGGVTRKERTRRTNKFENTSISINPYKTKSNIERYEQQQEQNIQEDESEEDELLKDYNKFNQINERVNQSHITKNNETIKNNQNYKHNYPGSTQNFMEPTPIINECSDSEEVDSNDGDDRLMQDFRFIGNSSQSHNSRGKGVEIAPPASFDYYTPASKVKPSTKRKLATEESIEAGLKFLRNEIEKKQTSKGHPSEMFLM